jgi:hypothetical protein
MPNPLEVCGVVYFCVNIILIYIICTVLLYVQCMFSVYFYLLEVSLVVMKDQTIAIEQFLFLCSCILFLSLWKYGIGSAKTYSVPVFSLFVVYLCL